MHIVPGFEKLDKFKSSVNEAVFCEGVAFSGLWNASKSLFIDQLKKTFNKPILIVTKSAKEEECLLDDFSLINAENVYSFPPWEVMPHEGVAPHRDVSADRFRVFHNLINLDHEPVTIITQVSSLVQKTVDPDSFKEKLIALKVSQDINFSELVRKIFQLGYERVDRVEAAGEYSVRGGIIDIYSLSYELPYRIEFWGDSIDTIRVFDPVTQLSQRQIGSIDIFPADEISFYKTGRTVPFFDFLPEDSIVIMDEPIEILKKLNGYENFIKDDKTFFISTGEIFTHINKFMHTSVSGKIQNTEPFFSVRQNVVFGITVPDFLRKNDSLEKRPHDFIDERLKDIDLLIQDGYRIMFAFNNTGEQQRFFEICDDKNYKRIKKDMSVIGHISGGFVFPETRFAMISDEEIFGRYRTRRSSRRFKYTVAIKDVSDINIGDFVVHVNYGIGKYHGVQRIKQLDGSFREMIVLEYAKKTKLYVPLIHSNFVQRYVGCGYKESSELDTLGTLLWGKKRRAAEESVLDLAAEFLDIQAARKVLKGNTFDKDSAWQREFETSFIYEETPDQNNAIEAVKSDMESDRPMDRLICGDVGYGKTEVAIRATFKAIMSNKQVAIMVPTTILAQQHYKVFTERMADYPVRVDMLSRFRTAGQQKTIIEELKQGTIDVIVGTHRLIQSDVKFKDLGLVIVDEEQRFGVTHKERFKLMRRMVDVLTMTATPIPRTLYLALVGARDMSTINTPPEDRLPVETHVTLADDKVIKQAIQRELNREGQVFFVHNRVKTIYNMEEKIKKLIPLAKTGVAHGQMHEKGLAQMMELFRAGKIDVLVCTTIIESGLDIPNANTIIIDRADRFGLADLYQLRGRVGRYKNRAYAYLLMPPYKISSEQAGRRINAIESHQELGAGFHIAMRDLEIRGAGNILGDKQHGHIAAVGFDLYCKMLRNAVASMKGETIAELPEVMVKLGFEPYIPSAYISTEMQRVAIYSRLQELIDIKQVKDLKKELKDIYGSLPAEVKILLNCILIKLYACQKNIDSVELKDEKLILKSGEYFITEDGLKYYRVKTEKNVSKLKQTVEIKNIIKNLDPVINCTF